MKLDWHFVHLGWIHLIWAALAIVGVLVALELRARGALAAFLSPVMQRRLSARPSVARTGLRLGLVLAALVAGVFALMRPQARGETETIVSTHASADVMFVLDVSRSMLAEDAAPNRLARAKAQIEELASRLQNDRVGLIAFAGRAAQVCPLTPDHAFFDLVLGTVDTNSAGRGGTRVGQAIKAAVRGFPVGQGAKLMVLITDGDDQDPYTQEAAKAAYAAGVKIVAVGLGSEQGSTITLTDPKTGAKTTLMYDGKPVISKLDGDALRKVALATKGAYVPAGTNAVDLDSIVEKLVRPFEREAADGTVRVVPVERYPWLVLACLGFLLASLWVGAGAGDRREP